MQNYGTIAAALLFLATPSVAGQAIAPLEPLAPSLFPVLSIQDGEEEGEESEEEKPLPDKREEVKVKLGELKGHAAKKGKEDKEAMAAVETLLVEFPKSGPKDRAAIAKGVAACLKQKRKAKDGVYDNALYMSCAFALGEMGPESGPEIIKFIGHKSHKSNLDLQTKLIQSLGKTKHEKGTKVLVDLLGNKDFPIEAAACQAIGQYAHLDLKERKKLFSEVLKALMSAKNAKDADINNQEPSVHERYATVSASMIGALETLSKHTEASPEDWQRWWNKNKKEDWDEAEDA